MLTGAPVILLGAGASVDAGLPTAARLTDMILDDFDKRRGRDLDTGAAFRFVHHIAEADRAARRSPGGVDIERLFAVVDLFATLDRHPLVPFVERWHGGLDRLAADRSHDHQFDRLFKDAVGEAALGRPGFAVSRLGRWLSGDRRAPESLFRKVRAEMLQCLPAQLHVGQNTDVSYVLPLLRCDAPVTVASLNYDLVIETAAERDGLTLTTGTERWEVEDDLTWRDDAAVHLLKLHGSVGWSMSEDGGSFTTSPPGANPHQYPGVIFGEGNKLTANGPFLPLYAEFTKRLRSASAVLVVGYSFRDSHVNAALIRWAMRNPQRMLVVVSPEVTQRSEGFYSDDPAVQTLRALRRATPTGEPQNFIAITKTAAEGTAEAIAALGATSWGATGSAPECGDDIT